MNLTSADVVVTERKKKAFIKGTGSYLPKNILTNADLEKMVDTTCEWIETRTGILERRLADLDEYASSMGALAALKALEDANVSKENIEIIIFCTSTPDYIFPSSAALAQNELGLQGVPAFDCMTACSGVLYGLALAKGFIVSGMYKNVLVISGDKLSSFVNYKDRATCILFGDGASACVVSDEGPGLEICSANLGADGSLAKLLMLPAGGSRNPISEKTITEQGQFLYMEGGEVFKHAVRRMISSSLECLKMENLNETDINWMIPHQANIRIINAVGKHFPSTRIFKNVHKYGNTAASSIGIALDELRKEHPLEDGNNLLLTVFGGGLSWGSLILKNCKGNIS
ncbi:beta-ketoacyl-ACP synthase III [Candidatus Clavichlamydia salmonicola]|uniref:beta-ketoacyl-ACP synthase III n=1 Tax=Candidatus Clavichlamydia salmonicola TaxID=469812 RepID=UPI0018914899|nr:beta-ketoacyl-ACP synthase III [Candidatus Clavichlamydia salmonicola]